MITLKIYIVNKPHEPFIDLVNRLDYEFPGLKQGNSEFVARETERTVQLTLKEQDGLTNEQRDWLIMSDYAICAVDDYPREGYNREGDGRVARGAYRPSDTSENMFKATVAQYGIPNAHGDILTEGAALEIFDQLREQETMPHSGFGYRISSVHMEGDRKSGSVYALFTMPSTELDEETTNG